MSTESTYNRFLISRGLEPLAEGEIVCNESVKLFCEILEAMDQQSRNRAMNTFIQHVKPERGLDIGCPEGSRTVEVIIELEKS